MTSRELRLRDEYVQGRIEIEEFEQRIDAILRSEPPPDESPPLTDAPGGIIYYTPQHTQNLAAVLKELYAPSAAQLMDQ